MKSISFLQKLLPAIGGRRRAHPGQIPMCTKKANETSVIRVPNFLSQDEVKLVLQVIDMLGLPLYTNDANDNLPSHLTSYLNTNNCFELLFPWVLGRIMRLAVATNRHTEQAWGYHLTTTKASDNRYYSRRERRRTKLAIATPNTLAATDRFGPGINVRVAEYHEMRSGGSLSSMHHCDTGSLLTIDIMLQEPGATSDELYRAFRPAGRPEHGQHGSTPQLSIAASSGGCFQTVNNQGDVSSVPNFHAGDALIFVSHKLHRVSPVVSGVRKVLVVELWNGPRRTCGHRCDIRQPGPCSVFH